MASSTRVNTVLFDLDDTLLDSFPARVKALRDVFDRVKLADIDTGQFLYSLNGANFKKVLERLAEERDIKEDLFVLYRRRYWFNKGDIGIFPGVRKMLRGLASRGCKLGIVTNKGRDFEFEGRRVGCMDELKTVMIDGYFSVIVGFEDVPEEKPHPHGINLALSKLGSKPQETLFVGDSAADIGAALNAGCRSCHVTWGIPGYCALPEELHPHYALEEPSELLELDCF